MQPRDMCSYFSPEARLGLNKVKWQLIQ